MRQHLLVAAVLCLLAAPALAQDGARVAPALRPSGALALVPPAAPLLGTAQGADDSGGSKVLMSALYGGAVGALVGLGIGLIEDDHYFRDIAIGAGAGIIVGAAFGAATSMHDRVPMTDGLGSTDRTPVLHGTRVSLLAGNF